MATTITAFYVYGSTVIDNISLNTGSKLWRNSKYIMLLHECIEADQRDSKQYY